MKLRDLEKMLSTIPPHPAPKVELEQYATPADLAAPLLHEAFALGDVAGRRVADLGCGTGVFAIGAALLGAAEVTGVDVDGDALAVARRESVRLRADVSWIESDVRAWSGSADTVVMNPPFGAQARGADRAFLDAAFRAAPVVYSLHNATTRGFVESYAKEAGHRVTHAWRLRFALRHQYRHHEKAVQEIEVVALRFKHDYGTLVRE
jgi:putative methylase